VKIETWDLIEHFRIPISLNSDSGTSNSYSLLNISNYFQLISLTFSIISMRTLYDILDCRPDDSSVDLKKAYHRSARKLHPDKNTSEFSKDDGVSTSKIEENGTTAFVELTKAWNILSNDESRRRYDSWLREQLLRERSCLLFDSFTVDEVMEKWNCVEDLKSKESASKMNAVELRRYVFDCRCGGEYVFDEIDEEMYGHRILYVLCSNCSLAVKIEDTRNNLSI